MERRIRFGQPTSPSSFVATAFGGHSWGRTPSGSRYLSVGATFLNGTPSPGYTFPGPLSAGVAKELAVVLAKILVVGNVGFALDPTDAFALVTCGLEEVAAALGFGVVTRPPQAVVQAGHH